MEGQAILSGKSYAANLNPAFSIRKQYDGHVTWRLSRGERASCRSHYLETVEGGEG